MIVKLLGTPLRWCPRAGESPQDIDTTHRTPGAVRILITGGTGFLGSYLCRRFAEQGNQVVSFDNLRRRGGELNINSHRRLGIEFVHGDIRILSDLLDLEGSFDLIVEASAEPSVHAGNSGSTRYLLETNFLGTANALDFARQRGGAMLFVSTNRVFAVSALRELPLKEMPTRLELSSDCLGQGYSRQGINEKFPTSGSGYRSLYGMTKLASEMLIEEYAESFGFPAIINRCGVLAGPGQFGKTDQGIFTLWVARHVFGGALKYTGFGGQGKQVRDLLHPGDFFNLVKRQLDSVTRWKGQTYNVGGGLAGTVSLQEYTNLCREQTGMEVVIGSQQETANVDIPFYATDFQKAETEFGWSPKIGPREIVSEIATWLRSEADLLRPIFSA